MSVVDHARETRRGKLHLAQCLGRHRDRRPLLNDLLESSLHGAITSREDEHVLVLVGHHLHLDVARAVAQPHQEDGRTLHLVCHLLVHPLDLTRLDRLANALAAAALGRLDHNRVADALCDLERLGGGAHAALEKGLIVHIDAAVFLDLHINARARPRDARHLRRLGNDGRGNLVAEEEHRALAGPDEDDAHLFARLRELRVLRCVAPAGPHRVDLVQLRHRRDQRDVCVVIEVWATRHRIVSVREVEVLRRRLHVLGRGHRNDVDQLVAAERLVQEVADRDHELGGSHSVVGDKDAADDLGATAFVHPLGVLLLGRHFCSLSELLRLKCALHRPPTQKKKPSESRTRGRSCWVLPQRPSQSLGEVSSNFVMLNATRREKPASWTDR